MCWIHPIGILQCAVEVVHCIFKAQASVKGSPDWALSIHSGRKPAAGHPFHLDFEDWPSGQAAFCWHDLTGLITWLSQHCSPCISKSVVTTALGHSFLFCDTLLKLFRVFNSINKQQTQKRYKECKTLSNIRILQCKMLSVFILAALQYKKLLYAFCYLQSMVHDLPIV